VVRGLLVNASAASEYGTTVERSCEESCVRQIYLSLFAVVLFLTTLCEQPPQVLRRGRLVRRPLQIAASGQTSPRPRPVHCAGVLMEKVKDSDIDQAIIDEYEIGETLGTGHFSKVKLGINRKTGEKVAIKVSSRPSPPPPAPARGARRVDLRRPTHSGRPHRSSPSQPAARSPC